MLGSHGKHLEDVVTVQLSLVQQEKEQGGHPVPLVFKTSPDLRFLVGFSLQREMNLKCTCHLFKLFPAHFKRTPYLGVQLSWLHVDL